jgi:hypothetical protein
MHVTTSTGTHRYCILGNRAAKRVIGHARGLQMSNDTKVFRHPEIRRTGIAAE